MSATPTPPPRGTIDAIDTLEIIGMPQDYGQRLRGVDMGPSALRVAGLKEALERLGFRVIDDGDIESPVMATQDAGEPNLRLLPAVVEGSKRLAEAVHQVLRKRHFPIVVGGDHSISIGTMAGLGLVEPKQGLIWIDAHGDFNTPATTPSGNIHGMALAVNLGYGDPRLTSIGGAFPKAREENTVLVGVRDLDPGERRALRDSNVTAFTIRDIDELGMKVVMERAIQLAAHGVDHVHLSFDMDVINPDEAPGVGTPVDGGITYREAHLALEMLADSKILTSVEFVEINPILDIRNRTSELAVELITSALGKKIL